LMSARHKVSPLGKPDGRQNSAVSLLQPFTSD
jgi:hypothetical protein